MTIKKELKYKVIDTSNKDKLISIKLKVSHNIDEQMYCVHKLLRNHLSDNRIRKANTKTRSEVRGGGKKPWKQKGTGRARAGSTRSPLWKGGGVIFGPKYRIYKSKINRKERRLGINTLLYNKAKNTAIINERCFSTNLASTKKIINTLNELGVKTNKPRSILIVVENKKHTTYMSIRNIPNIELISRQSLNALSLLKADLILITTEAISQLDER